MDLYCECTIHIVNVYCHKVLIVSFGEEEAYFSARPSVSIFLCTFYYSSLPEIFILRKMPYI